MDMTKDGQNLYFDDSFMKQPNHERVERLLHEMEFLPRRDRRKGDTVHQTEHRGAKSRLRRWIEKLTR
jgi:hypothetical protein